MDNQRKKYTPEPWETNSEYENIVTDGRGNVICETPMGYSKEKARDTTSRIAKCVNACARIENPEDLKDAIEVLQCIADECENDGLYHQAGRIKEVLLKLGGTTHE